MSDNTEHPALDRAAKTMKFLEAAQHVAGVEGDYDSAKILQAEAIARWLLAVADAINSLRNGTQHDMSHPGQSTPGGGEIPDNSESLAAQIDALAADLWAADPNNSTPARTFDEDYGAAQDRYRAMARAALGLKEEDLP